MSFLYSLLLKLLYPTSLCLVLLACAVVFRKRKALCRACFGLAVGVLLVCGNGWLVGGLTRHLEWQFPALQDDGTTEGENRKQKAESRNGEAESRGQRTEDRGQDTGPQVSGFSPHPSNGSQLSTLIPQPDLASGPRSVVSGPPIADCIVVLSGGVLPRTPPRPTVEVADAGDRLLYGAYLLRKGRAPQIICTGNVATGGIAPRPVAEDMAEFLELLGIPKSSILTEIQSENTHEHAKYLYPILRERGFQRVLLVTSAMHMRRALGVFKKLCPGIVFIPAPTDFHVVEGLPMPWYRHLVALIPTPRSLLDFCEVEHEYLGIAYYRMRGWM